MEVAQIEHSEFHLFRGDPQSREEPLCTCDLRWLIADAENPIAPEVGGISEHAIATPGIQRIDRS